MSLQNPVIFNFKQNANINSWRVVDDTVMGGRSSGTFQLNKDGHGEFKGFVTTKNNGGFSSVRANLNRTSVTNFTKIVIRLKGDKKKYQFRIKANNDDYYSYVKEFYTSGEWEEITIALKNMYPTFRGRNLDMNNFNADAIEEIGFLVGTSGEENFKLLLDRIELR